MVKHELAGQNLVLSGFHVHDGCFVSLRLQVFTSPFLTTYSIHFPPTPFTPTIPALSIPIIHCNVADTCSRLSKDEDRERDRAKVCLRETGRD